MTIFADELESFYPAEFAVYIMTTMKSLTIVQMQAIPL